MAQAKKAKAKTNSSARMNQRQKKFAELYLKYWNGTRAAIEAGYAKDSASSQAYSLLRNPKVSEYIRGRLCAQDGVHVAQTDEVLAFFTSVMRGEVKDQFDLDAALSERIKAGVELLKRYEFMATHELSGKKEPIEIVISDRLKELSK